MSTLFGSGDCFSRDSKFHHVSSAESDVDMVADLLPVDGTSFPMPPGGAEGGVRQIRDLWRANMSARAWRQFFPHVVKIINHVVKIINQSVKITNHVVKIIFHALKITSPCKGQDITFRTKK